VDRSLPADDAGVTIAVIRSGGIAGMRRAWRAEPAPSEVPHWAALIDDCPWDDPAPDPVGADRFMWRIVARWDTPRAADTPRERTAALPDHVLEGPWLALVDEVRARGLAVSPDDIG
jgi:hypothetical protein